MRVLVAMANHGTKNQQFALTVLDEYRSMSHDVDVVVLSDQPKSLGDDVEILVGAPTSDPRSLPFAHRPLFAQRVDDYDLFVYTEDDTLITQRHLDAFVEVNDLLPDDEVPGFQRYEEDASGERNYSSVHSTYRWIPESVMVAGGEVFAEHSNLHSACYVLTRAQLRIAIASGGFLVPPHRGPFWSLMVTAISDVYSQCGLRRRLCVSRIDDFLLHHLPNVYLDRFGVGEEEYRTQIDAIERIAHGDLSREQLIDPESDLDTQVWDVPQHPVPAPELIDLISPGTHRPLSVGSTSGVVELAAFPSAQRIIAVPVDEVTGAVARTRGIVTLHPRLDDIEASSPTGGFDTIFFHHTLHHFADPARVLRQLRRVAAPRCDIVVAVPNASYHALRRIARRPYAGPVPIRSFARDGIHAPGIRFLRAVGQEAGLAWRFHWPRPEAVKGAGRLLPNGVERWIAPQIFAVGRYRL